MPRLTYERWNSKPETMQLAQEAAAICRDYAAQGYDLTLRQLYYQFISRDRFPNTEKSYDKLGYVVDLARMAGLIDWYHVTDRTRSIVGNGHWESPADIIASAAGGYMIDKWDTQPVRVQVWVEKEALAGVVSRAANAMDVEYFSCRGYSSTSAMWRAAQKIGSYLARGQRVIILHLGDHDPSGIDMTRDNRDRLKLFIGADWVRDQAPELAQGREPYEVRWDEVADSIRDQLRDDDGDAEPFEFRRIALNRDQVNRYNPPPNPAKVTDSRAAEYIRQHGHSSWELDALDPATLDALIREHIEEARNETSWEWRLDDERQERSVLQDVSDRWADVVEYLRTTDEGE